MGIINLFVSVFQPIISLLSKKSLKRVYLLLIIVLFSAFAEVGIVGFLYRTLSENSYFGVVENTNQNFAPQFFFITAVISATVLRLLSIKYQFKISSDIGVELSSKILTNILNKNLSWHIKNNSSLSISLITRDTEQLVAAVQSALTFFSNFVLTTVLFIGLVIILRMLVVYLILILLIYYLIIYRFIKYKINDNSELMTSSYSKSVKVAQEALGGIRDTILSSTEDFYLKQFINHTKKYRTSLANIQLWQASPRYLIESFILLIFLFLAIFSSNYFSANNFIPTIGALVTGAYRLLSPIQQSFLSLTTIDASSATINKLKTLKLEKNLRKRSRKSKKNNSLETAPHIKLKNVSFSYDKTNNVLEKINLEIRPSSFIAIAGVSGSGKSTLSDLILGLISPTSGEILFDGQNNPKYLRENIWPRNYVGILPQDIFLFDGNLYQNITLEDSDDEDMIHSFEKAINLSQLKDFVNSNNAGRFLKVGERGERISGGQKQRIGLARALYRNHKLLILDESTSALDSYTESQIINNLKGICKQDKMTIILISHRLNTLKNCDNIFFLDNGILESKGSFDYLVKNSEKFRKLLNN